MEINFLAKIVFVCGCLVSLAAQAEIYKWLDENGRVHYSDKPHKEAKSIEVDVSKKGHITTSQKRKTNQKNLIDAFDEDHKRENKAKEKLKKHKKKMAKDCIRSKDQLRRYDRANYLYNLDEQGNRVAISNQDRAQVTARLKKKIKKYCK